MLREKATPFATVDDEVRRLAAEMIETMRAERGVGLAAQQIGITDSICTIEVPPDYDVDPDGNRQHPHQAMPMVLINPEITSFSDESWVAEEGCLSFPNINAPIKRAMTIQLRYLDLENEIQEVELTGFLARVVQHEIDHLRGVLFNDHMTAVKRAAISGRLKRMRRDTRARLGMA